MQKLIRKSAPWILLAAAARASAATVYVPAVQTGIVTAPQIVEGSGLAASRVNSGVLWTHNDGPASVVFALSTNGALLGTFTLDGASGFDYEDMAIGPGPAAGTSYLYVADIGDNNFVRPSISVYRVAEPAVSTSNPPTNGNLAVEKITLNYPDGSHNAETLMVDPASGDLYIATKANDLNARFYRAAFPQSTSEPVTMEHLATAPGIRATAGDMSPDGTEVLVRTLTHAYQWTRDSSETWAQALLDLPVSFALATEKQGESLAFAAPSAAIPGFYTHSEFTNQPLYFYAAVPEPGMLSAAFLLGGFRLGNRRRHICNRSASFTSPPVR